jgi:hypothetical protein
MTHVTPYDTVVTVDMTHVTTCNKHIRRFSHIRHDTSHNMQQAHSTF